MGHGTPESKLLWFVYGWRNAQVGTSVTIYGSLTVNVHRAWASPNERTRKIHLTASVQQEFRSTHLSKLRFVPSAINCSESFAFLGKVGKWFALTRFTRQIVRFIHRFIYSIDTVTIARDNTSIKTQRCSYASTPNICTYTNDRKIGIATRTEQRSNFSQKQCGCISPVHRCTYEKSNVMES